MVMRDLFYVTFDRVEQDTKSLCSVDLFAKIEAKG